jgi:hypothetical protein
MMSTPINNKIIINGINHHFLLAVINLHRSFKKSIRTGINPIQIPVSRNPFPAKQVAFFCQK